MKNFVDLMSLASSDTIKLIEGMEKKLPIVTTANVRGHKLKVFNPYKMPALAGSWSGIY